MMEIEENREMLDQALVNAGELLAKGHSPEAVVEFMERDFGMFSYYAPRFHRFIEISSGDRTFKVAPVYTYTIEEF